VYVGERYSIDRPVDGRPTPASRRPGTGTIRPWFGSCILYLFLPAVLSLLTARWCAADELESVAPYRNAASILALSAEGASSEHPASVRGVVTQSTDFGLVVQDSSAGIWIYWDHPADFAPGDDVLVEGVVQRGRYAPVVRAHSVRKLGRAPLPAAKEVTYRQLSAGNEECQYVSVTGTVRSVAMRNGASSKQKLWLKLDLGDGFVNASLPGVYASAAGRMIDAVVRIQAAAMSTKNENRQITGITLSVPGLQNVTVLRPSPADLFAMPLTPIGRLMQYRSGTDYWHRVRVSGIATFSKPGESLILEENGKALLVRTTQTTPIQLGDRVEALGFPAERSSGPILQDAVVRRAAGASLLPTPVKVPDICSGSLNYNLVTTEGQLLRRVHEPSREVLLLQDGPAIVLVELGRSEVSEALERLEEGSMVRITGISVLDVQGAWNYGMSSASAIECRLLLRSPEDVQVLAPPSWWTTRHVLYIAAILGALVLAFLGLVVYSRVEHWRLRAIHQERERLANEIHDTLAQSFSGIGFQLQAIRKAIPHESHRLQKQVDLACELVRHSHKEARRSIEPLPLDPRERIDLLSSLEDSARKMVEGGLVEVEAFSSGNPRPLSPRVADTLLRIGQESIANAVRHADPTHLQISLLWEKDVVRLAVCDNGIGFVKSGGLLGFGLRGMRKRAASINARLEISSQPNQGTRIEAAAPLPPGLSLGTLFRRKWIYLSERVVHVQGKQQFDSDSDR
jgi:signal transduction histidine kinase